MPDRDLPRAVFFDLDGTLANSIDLMWKVFEDFFTNCGIAPTLEMFEQYNGVPLLHMIAELAEQHSINGSLEKLTADYLAQVDRTYLDVTPYEGADQLLSSLKTKGCFLGLVTSNSVSRVNRWLANHDLTEHFDKLVCAEDVKRGKPDPEPYKTALRAFGGPAKQAVVVEDAPFGAQSGLAAGMRTIAICDSPETVVFPDEVKVVPNLFALAREIGLDQV